MIDNSMMNSHLMNPRNYNHRPYMNNGPNYNHPNMNYHNSFCSGSDALNEVFVGNLHPETIEVDLLSIFSQIGTVKNTRIIRTHENTCRGYAFVVFESSESVQKAIEELQGFVLHNKPMILRDSQINHVLFLVGIKRSWNRDHIDKTIRTLFPGVSRVSIVEDPSNTKHNRGFCFVRFDSHQLALQALNKINEPGFTLGESKSRVQANWADTQLDFEGDEGINKKALYVTPISVDACEEEIITLFKPYGVVSNVALATQLPNVPRKNFAFVNFETEEEASNALKHARSLKFRNIPLEVSYAHRTERTRLNRQSVSETQVCRYYFSSTGCRNGFTCKYSHNPIVQYNYQYYPAM